MGSRATWSSHSTSSFPKSCRLLRKQRSKSCCDQPGNYVTSTSFGGTELWSTQRSEQPACDGTRSRAQCAKIHAIRRKVLRVAVLCWRGVSCTLRRDTEHRVVGGWYIIQCFDAMTRLGFLVSVLR